MTSPLLGVTCMEALAPPPLIPVHAGPERVTREVPDRMSHLDLYQRAGFVTYGLREEPAGPL